MTADPLRDVRDALAELAPADPGIRSAVTLRRDSAFLSLLSASDPTAWAIVHSTGSTWFSLVVDGHYTRDVIDVDLTDREMREHLAALVDIALAHLHGGSRLIRRAGRHRLAVAVDGAELLLFAPLDRMLARFSPLRARRVRARLSRAADGLLADRRLPPIEDSWMIVHPETWELLVDLDALQAGLAGSSTWRRTTEGGRIRRELAGEALLLADALAELGLVDVAVGLSDLAAQIDRY
ncbi:hypothetical protein FVO59_11660 [Microbacterium esteraromaticum]|uniref:Uncharacterized protein n=1 Tax=Microbacterium esteraromaticum TaxID=57043 RepID=A0A7D8AKK4_9MICO|nr:hypothetical protein [Microbacterium esteraromaticum]QMU97789.1 hypothetical protein FVO59_11660 [Microbacterium esteraromaticum]